MFSAEMANPETYYFPPTRYVPNSRLSVLVYRGAFSPPYDEAAMQIQLEKNKWFKGVSADSSSPSQVNNR